MLCFFSTFLLHKTFAYLPRYPTSSPGTAGRTWDPQSSTSNLDDIAQIADSDSDGLLVHRRKMRLRMKMASRSVGTRSSTWKGLHS